MKSKVWSVEHKACNVVPKACPTPSASRLTPHAFRLTLFALLLVVIIPAAVNAQGLELSGYLAFESRLFPQSPLLEQQFSGGTVSLSAQPELYYDWSDGYQSILFVPFVRIDQHNGDRTHFDIRELYWQRVWDAVELGIGIRKIFWGVTESQHLVDIINQTDQVENLDTEDKLGQPMINVTLVQNFGTIDLYVMPVFRERSFLKGDARLRAPVSINTAAVRYESGKVERHLNWAVRWFQSLGVFDIGLSHFSGTNREPVLIPDLSDSMQVALLPFYHRINQTGLDLQATTGGWLLKLEAINRFGQGERFTAAVGGFEYTFANIKGSGIDVGVLLEYHYDERGKDATTPFDDDIFFGSRLAFNDVQSTDVLGGVIIDRDTGSTFLNIEASRRIGNRYKIEFEIRSFLGASSEELLYGLRKDHYLQIELARYF